MSFFSVKLSELSELSNKSVSTKETQNEEVHRSEINLETVSFNRWSSIDSFECFDSSTSDKETLSENNNLPSSSFYYLYLLLKNKLFNFFKILKRRSVNLVLPSYVMKCKKPVSTSLFILKGVKPVVFLLRNKLFKKLNFFLYVVVSPPLHYLYVCFLDVGRRANSKITSFKFYQKSFGSCGERFLRVACRMVSSFVCVAFSFFCSYFFFSSY